MLANGTHGSRPSATVRDRTCRAVGTGHCAHPRTQLGPPQIYVPELGPHGECTPDLLRQCSSPYTIEPRQTPTATHVFDAQFWCLQNFNLLCEPAQCTQRSRVQSAVEHSLRANYRERERRDSETLVTRRGTRLARAPTRRKKGRAATRVFSLQPCPCSRACRASRKARSSSNCHVSPPGRQG